MSFKREGDDRAWLNVLRKRRVSELFALNIPDDEALLVKNGRFACLVCRHRPVFDTVATLAVHRSGKKHAVDAEVFMAQKSELEELKLVRKHERYMNGRECSSIVSCGTSRTSTNTSSRGLLNACVYDPRTKRRNVGPHARRQIVNVDDEAPAEGAPAATTVDGPSGVRRIIPPRQYGPPDVKPPQTIAEIRKHLRQQDESENPAPLKPYVGKQRDTRTRTTAIHNTASSFSNLRSVPERMECAVSNKSTTAGLDDGQSRVACKTLRDSAASPCSSLIPLIPVLEEQTVRQTQQIANYFVAVGSGWKRDRDGTWIKDPSVEFESDDEPPEIL